MVVEVQWVLRFRSLNEYHEFKNAVEALRMLDLDLNRMLKEEHIALRRDDT